VISSITGGSKDPLETSVDRSAAETRGAEVVYTSVLSATVATTDCSMLGGAAAGSGDAVTSHAVAITSGRSRPSGRSGL
jgi:hypothetical protein